MTPTSKTKLLAQPAPRAAPADSAELAASRVKFLTADEPAPVRVRTEILASWRRSRDLHVAAEKIELPYIRDPELDNPLTRSAEPVLRRLRDQLDGQPVSIIVTDQTGLVLSRRTGDAALERHLDSVRLAPGFSYAEEFAGTNGIGTALEAGTATHVFGHEHYAENLEDLACAGVPLHHPISGRTVGAVDLTCWRKDAGGLLLTLAKATAAQIQQALLADSAPHELEVFQAYRRTCRRVTGVVFALTNDVVMLNDFARAVLDPVDQAALFALAAQSSDPIGSARRIPITLQLPTGTTARMHCEHVRVGEQFVGVVVHVKLGEPERAHLTAHEAGPPMLLPGLVGQAPLWLRASHEVEAAFQAGEWLAVEGEAGVGKLALLRAVQVRGPLRGRFSVLDAADASTDPSWPATVRRAILEDADSVVIRHVDRLDATRLRAVSSALQEATSGPDRRPLWAAVTLASTAVPNSDLAPLLRLFPTTVEVPPLRMHLDDLDALVAFFLSRHGNGARVTCSPAAMRLLMRANWPGNIAQLHKLVNQVLQHRRSGVIQPADLPPESQTVSRRLLSPLESMERDAIVKSLTDARGSKVKAARSLGMSRATIYRKIHEYGIYA
jgi:sigma-54 dependent transcriptional regulator, acetoin dehydrogenase operon transcriptional activator AcoR